MTTTQFTFDEDTISDLHKDAYGFRPTESFWTFWNEATDVQKQATWDSLVDTMEASVAREREEQARSVEIFEALVAKTISHGAQDRETALRWIMDESGCDGDWDYLAWANGLPYQYFRKAA